MKIVNILFLISILSMSFISEKREVLNTKKDITYLALGDSYTIGEGVKVEERWPYQLAHLLNIENKIVKNPEIIAKTGWTTDELSDAIILSGNKKKYDLVSLAIGVNNQYRGRKPEEYRTQLDELLKTAIEFANNNPDHVFMLSIPDWGITPFASGRDGKKIAKEIDQFNAVAKEECKKFKIRFIEITEISRTYNKKDMLVSDQLHYSGKMYKMWAEKALSKVKNINF